MRLTIDRETDAAYVYVTDYEVARTRTLDENRIVDLDSAGEIRGIELLNISRGVELDGLPFAKELSDLFRDNGIREHA